MSEKGGNASPPGDHAPTPFDELDDDAPFFQALVESFPQLTLVFDEVGTITYASPAALLIAGAIPDTALGGNIAEYLEPEELALGLDALGYKLDHPDDPLRPLEIHLKVDGHRRSVDITGRAGTDAVNEGIAVLLSDTTRRAILRDILDSVMRSEPIEHTLGTIAELASEQLRLASVVVAYESEGGGFASMVTKCVDPELAELSRRPDPTAGAAPWDVALRTGDVVTQVGYELPDDIRRRAADRGYASCWSVPLVSAGEHVLGCITLWIEDSSTAAPAERVFLRRLARTTTFALDRWRRDQELAYAAGHDALTGARNRAGFVQDLERARGSDHGFSALLAVDLDGFKLVNERHGHLAGDALLTAITDRIRRAVRDGDVVARLGGDEFAVLCPGVTDLAQATALADRIIASSQEPITVYDSEVSVGVSVGVAIDILPGGSDHAISEAAGGEPADDWAETSIMARADAALYAAKAAGKGCWRVAEPAVPGARAESAVRAAAGDGSR